MNLETKKHILVVEDEEHLAVGIKYNLEAEGFQVTTVGNGLVALKAIESQSLPVDLIVLDLMLPGMSGYEVCEQVRQSGKRMPILMLSARTLSEDRTHGFAFPIISLGRSTPFAIFSVPKIINRPTIPETIFSSVL